MISKERLEELIKEGATIYGVPKYDKKIYKLDAKNYSIDDNELNYLFETKKQAEWALKYHATRTEELNLPMWEEWCENIENYCETITFSDIHYNNYEMFIEGRNDDEAIMITKYPSGQYIFFEPNTQENYIKACDLCLKLFKGEE
jgi:hypothetical protein